MGQVIVIAGVVTMFNFVILIHKFRKGRYFDFTLDLLLMCFICYQFVGSFSALCIGMIASMGISIYLLFKPVRLPSIKQFLFPERKKPLCPLEP